MFIYVEHLKDIVSFFVDIFAKTNIKSLNNALKIDILVRPFCCFRKHLNKVCSCGKKTQKFSIRNFPSNALMSFKGIYMTGWGVA